MTGKMSRIATKAIKRAMPADDTMAPVLARSSSNDKQDFVHRRRSYSLSIRAIAGLGPASRT